MILKYDFAAIEPKWQKRWEEGKIFAASDRSEKPKFYGLIEFPYPTVPAPSACISPLSVI